MEGRGTAAEEEANKKGRDEPAAENREEGEREDASPGTAAR